MDPRTSENARVLPVPFDVVSVIRSFTSQNENEIEATLRPTFIASSVVFIASSVAFIALSVVFIALSVPLIALRVAFIALRVASLSSRVG